MGWKAALSNQQKTLSWKKLCTHFLCISTSHYSVLRRVFIEQGAHVHDKIPAWLWLTNREIRTQIQVWLFTENMLVYNCASIIAVLQVDWISSDPLLSPVAMEIQIPKRCGVEKNVNWEQFVLVLTWSILPPVAQWGSSGFFLSAIGWKRKTRVVSFYLTGFFCCCFSPVHQASEMSAGPKSVRAHPWINTRTNASSSLQPINMSPCEKGQSLPKQSFLQPGHKEKMIWPCPEGCCIKTKSSMKLGFVRYPGST